MNLCNYEKMILRDAAGECVPSLLPGSALNAARETLVESGYLNRNGEITAKGKEALK